MSERFEIVAQNPNQTNGGGGCLCSEAENPDTEGPFVVFYHQEMASNASPHAVLCAHCAIAAVDQIEEGDVLAGGEPADDADVVAVSHAISVDGDIEEIPEV